MPLVPCPRAALTDNPGMQNAPKSALDAPEAALDQPRSKTDLFLSFTFLALQGFGGVLAVVQREMVEKKRWLTREEFLEDWAVAQIMPGPNVVNLSMMIGGRHFGLPGALAALAGMLTAPLLIVLVMVALYGSVADSAYAQGALRGMGAVAAGLITATGIKLVSALDKNPMGLGLCIALAGLTFVAIALLRWPLVWVLLGIGGAACVWAFRVLGRVNKHGVTP
jgi:chromate transporter